MIIVPTGELVGILADVIPFAATDKDLPSVNAVRLEWDGQHLHALATDRVRVGISTWDPDDDPEEDAQDDLFTEMGGADDAWAVVMPLPDAKDMVSAYKLDAKGYNVPLTVDAEPGRVKVVRSRDTGHSAITMAVDCPLSLEFPDVRAILDKAQDAQPFASICYTAKALADFAKVRPRGPLKLTFTGERGLTRVSIGERFLGAIVPVRERADDDGE